jgi:hypothetical protein
MWPAPSRLLLGTDYRSGRRMSPSRSSPISTSPAPAANGSSDDALALLPQMTAVA